MSGYGGPPGTMKTTNDWNKLNGFLADKVTESGSYTHYYIGLRKIGGTWRWAKAGSPGVMVPSDDSRWQSSEPSGDSREVCVEINSFYRNQYGHLNNVRCDVKYQAQVKTSPRGYICEDL